MKDNRKNPYFVDDEKKGQISLRIRSLRTKRNFTQGEFAEQFAYFIGKDHPFRYSTVSNWENGKPPREKLLYKIADFFDVPASTFYLKEDRIIPQNDIGTVRLKDLTKAELNEIRSALAPLDGTPVWCVFGQENRLAEPQRKWGIVDCRAEMIVFSASYFIAFNALNCTIYRRPVQFEYAFEAAGDSLLRTEVERKKSVWVEPLGGSYDMRQTLKGFGRYDKYKDCLLMEDGRAYPMASYLKTFVCFVEEPTYSKEEPVLDLTYREELEKMYREQASDALDRFDKEHNHSET